MAITRIDSSPLPFTRYTHRRKSFCSFSSPSKHYTIFPENAVLPFGSVLVTDDLFTFGPDITSEVIGNARVLARQDVLSLIYYMDFGFTRGEFNGNSFGVFSRNPITETHREVAVVVGRGKFRMAKGFALLTTFSVSGLGNAVAGYNVTLFHH